MIINVVVVIVSLHSFNRFQNHGVVARLRGDHGRRHAPRGRASSALPAHARHASARLSEPLAARRMASISVLRRPRLEKNRGALGNDSPFRRASYARAGTFRQLPRGEGPGSAREKGSEAREDQASRRRGGSRAAQGRTSPARVAPSLSQTLLIAESDPWHHVARGLRRLTAVACSAYKKSCSALRNSVGRSRCR